MRSQGMSMLTQAKSDQHHQNAKPQQPSHHHVPRLAHRSANATAASWWFVEDVQQSAVLDSRERRRVLEQTCPFIRSIQ
jgi:hypothetical protein